MGRGSVDTGAMAEDVGGCRRDTVAVGESCAGRADDIDVEALGRMGKDTNGVDAEQVIAGRRCTTVFTVTRLDIVGEVDGGSEAPGFWGNTRYVLPLGIGGVIREVYIVF